MKNTLVLILLICLSAFHVACKDAGDNTPDQGADLDKLSNQVIIDWNLAVFEAMGGPAEEHTLLASRLNAMVHLAMHDALNAIDPRFQTYAFHGKNKLADPVAAAATAAYEVLAGSLPNQKGMLDGQLAASLAAVPEGEGKTQGIDLGKKCAAAILALRQNDGAFQDPMSPVPPSNGQAGVYQAVPPFDILYGPFWKTMQPFSLQKPDQFRIVQFPALNTQAYAEGFNEVKRIGQKDSPHRSAEQTAIAKFWYELSDIGWNRVTRTVATDQKLGLLSTARLFALVNMALTDAYTAGWDSKFYYNFWRPYTAIRSADIDGNPNTEADPLWEPSEPTPPVQDYPSTHSALGNAAATVLATLLGDHVPFTMSSITAFPAGSTRSFTRFSDAARENADSRVYAGIHFRFSCERGLEMGQKVGKWTVENHLKPVE